MSNSDKLSKDIEKAVQRLEEAKDAYRESADESDRSLREAMRKLPPLGLQMPETEEEKELVEARTELRRLESLK